MESDNLELPDLHNTHYYRITATRLNALCLGGELVFAMGFFTEAKQT